MAKETLMSSRGGSIDLLLSEVVVLPDATKYSWSGTKPVNYVDELVFERLKQLQLNPSQVSEDPGLSDVFIWT